ncbi:MAG: Type 1 glutamine amidotransferase-like domain-containing protein [Acidimicrobiales bacterium]
MSGPGVLALVGGEEWTPGCSFDAGLLAASGGRRVTVLPTATAFERPDLALARARAWFAALGAEVEAVEAYGRSDALDPAHVSAVRGASFLYLSSGSAMHLLSALKRTPLWDAVTAAHGDGAVLAVAGSSASVVCDAMVDPRGGGFGVGLGLVRNLTLIPDYNRWSAEGSSRTISLAPKGLALAGIDDRTALIREPDGRWRAEGAGAVRVFVDGRPAGLEVLSPPGS